MTPTLLDPRQRACVVSSEGFTSVVLPAPFDYVVVAAANDPGNEATALAVDRARESIADRGQLGDVMFPPAPCYDWNSLLKEYCHVATQ
jgi:hypothetical protein